MPINLGATSVTAAYVGAEQVAVYLGTELLLASGAFSFFAGRTGDYAVEFIAEDDTTDPHVYFDVGTPTVGTLLRAHPSNMFTDNTVQRIGRLRHSPEPSSEGVHLHRRGGGVAWTAFLGTLGQNSAVYIINVTDRQYLVFRTTDTTDDLTFSQPAGASNNFVNWSNTDVVDEKRFSLPANATADNFMDDLATKQVIIALSTQNTYVPVFP